MKVTKEGIYRDKKGREVKVFNVGKNLKENYFRAYLNGSYYNVNTDEYGITEWEVTEFVRDFD